MVQFILVRCERDLLAIEEKERLGLDNKVQNVEAKFKQQNKTSKIGI